MSAIPRLLALCIFATALASLHGCGGGRPPAPGAAPAAAQSAEELQAEIEALRLENQQLRRELVAGDFNTNEDNPMFVSEATLRSFYGAHFRSCFRDMHRSQCVTHPGDGKYPPATFDYILYLGFEHIVGRRIYDGTSVSDHNPVAIRLR